MISTKQYLEIIDRFYKALKDLEERLGGTKKLAKCHGRMGWPERGIYFFFESGERRSNDSGSRVVRVGTNALRRGSRITFWNRLRAHRGLIRGRRIGGGNHRNSVFRLHVGTAILRKDGLEGAYPTWGVGSSAKKGIRNIEHPIEKRVSKYIASMPFLWLESNDSYGPNSERAYIVRNSLALLSNYGKLGTPLAIDSPSEGWLGHYCASKRVRESGLWNSGHISINRIDLDFINIFEMKIEKWRP